MDDLYSMRRTSAVRRTPLSCRLTIPQTNSQSHRAGPTGRSGWRVDTGLMLSQFCQWMTSKEGCGRACGDLATRAETLVCTECEQITAVLPSCDEHPRAWMLKTWCNACDQRT